jgi:ABC-type iron transport system FetAB permease component
MVRMTRVGLVVSSGMTGYALGIQPIYSVPFLLLIVFFWFADNKRKNKE